VIDDGTSTGAQGRGDVGQVEARTREELLARVNGPLRDQVLRAPVEGRRDAQGLGWRRGAREEGVIEFVPEKVDSWDNRKGLGPELISASRLVASTPSRTFA